MPVYIVRYGLSHKFADEEFHCPAPQRSAAELRVACTASSVAEATIAVKAPAVGTPGVAPAAPLISSLLAGLTSMRLYPLGTKVYKLLINWSTVTLLA
ncbi:hypothetical protein D3C87_1216600 [compost metagenome]